MHEFAGIIVTPESKPLEERMEKFCDYDGIGKPEAFCDGWATIFIDEDENLHRNAFGGDGKMSVYCPTLGSYRIRNMVNPHYGKGPIETLPYFPVGLAVLVTPSDEVFYDDDTDLEELLAKYCEEHPDWGIYVINYHA